MPDFFTESWSLSIEEFSYILGPLVLFLFLLIKRNESKKFTFLLTTIGVILLGFVLRIKFNQEFILTSFSDWSHSLRKVVIYRIDSIYYGFLGAYIIYYHNKLWQSVRYSSVILGIFLFVFLHGLIMILSLTPVTNSIFFNIGYLPVLLISLLLIFPYFTNLRKPVKFLVKPIEYISITSYALYLVNYSLILLTLQQFINVNELFMFEKIGVLLLYWVLTFILSYLLFTFFERPVMNLRDRKFIKDYYSKL